MHMDLFVPSRTRSIGENHYALVLVDDYSRYTWILFISAKNDTCKVFKKFANVIQNEKDLRYKSIRSDHEGEFQKAIFETYCEENGISHNFSAPRTSQQNGVVERKNRSMKELARTMLNENNLPKYFWADAVSTACYVLNRVLIRPVLKLTPYELFKGRKPTISHLKIFGCKCFVLNNDKSNIGKFDSKADEGIFLGYSLISKVYRVYNKRTLTIEESIHVAFDECLETCTNMHEPRKSDEFLETEGDLAKKPQNVQIEEKTIDTAIDSQLQSQLDDLPKVWTTPKDMSLDNMIGDMSKGISTRKQLSQLCLNVAFVSQIEPKTVDDALKDENWYFAKQEELN